MEMQLQLVLCRLRNKSTKFYKISSVAKLATEIKLKILCFVDTVYILNTLLSTHQTIQYCALNSTYLYFKQTQAIISFTVSTQYGMGIVVFNTPLSHTIGHCWDDLPSQSFDWCKNNLPNQSVADTSKTTITTTDDTKRNLNNNS